MFMFMLVIVRVFMFMFMLVIVRVFMFMLVAVIVAAFMDMHMDMRIIFMRMRMRMPAIRRFLFTAHLNADMRSPDAAFL